jgi:hypothetical protein
MSIPSLPPATPHEQAANLRGCSLNGERILVGPVQRSGAIWFLLAVLLAKSGKLETHMVVLPVRAETDPEQLYIIPLKDLGDLSKIPALFQEAAESARWGLVAHLRGHFKQVESPKDNVAFANAIDRFRLRESELRANHD